MRANNVVLGLLVGAAFAGAGRAEPTATTALPATNYVQNGLVAHYDGIENAGAGLHDGTATSWVDLKGALPSWTANGSRAWCADTTYEIQGAVSGQHSAWMNGNLPSYLTLEIGFRWDEGQQLLSQNKDYQRIFILNWDDGTFGANRTFYGKDSSVVAGSTNFITAVYGGAGTAPTGYYLNGVPVGTTVTKTYGWSLGTYPALGSRYNVKDCNFRGGIHAMRFYSRVLTTAEVRLNHALDAMRFKGATSNDTGYAWTADKLLVRFRTQTNGSGAVSLKLGETIVGADVSLWTETNADVTVTATATPASGWVFEKWSGDTTGLTSLQTTSPSVTVAADQARALTAVFRLPVTCCWRGTTSSSAAVAANWSDETLPRTGDLIVLDGIDDNAQRALTWDLDDVTPGSWTQDGYTNVVTFMTGTPGVRYYQTTPAVHGVLISDNTREFHVSGNVTVNSGTWTVPSHPAHALSSPYNATSKGMGSYRLTVKVGGDLVIGAGASVNLNLKGMYCTGETYGSGAVSGSHGGRGEVECYGSVYRPKELGCGTYQSWGGGACWLQAEGSVTVNGSVSAASGTETYAGAAGSVLLVGDSIRGSGKVTASAPSAWDSGGAGRVAFIQTGAARDFSQWTGTAEAMGNGGASGTVYFETADRPYAGDLLVRGKGSAYYGTDGKYPYDRPSSDRNRRASAMLTGIFADGQDYIFDTVTIDNYGCLGVGTNCTLRFNTLNCVGQAKNSLALYGGTLVLTGPTTFTNMSFRAVLAGSTIKFADGVVDRTLTIGEKCTFAVDALTHIEGNLVVTNGGCVTHTSITNPGTTHRVNLDVTGDVTIAQGGSISATGIGYKESASAPGYPSVTDRGGSHGGLNRDSGTAVCYGSIRRPVTPGSSARSASSGYGGGVITLKASGDLKVDGSIVSQGDAAWWSSGAGGSIWLTVRTLSGTGTINANGGSSSAFGTGAGGGGRVSVWLTGADADFSSFPLARINAYEGALSRDKSTAAAGTVYLKTGNEGESEGTLYVANRWKLYEPDVAAAQIGSQVTDTDVGNVVVTNLGALRVDAGCSLTVSRDFHTFTNGRFKAQLSDDAEVANGTVTFVDATVESHVTGSNAFANLACATPGKTIRFGTAAEDSVAVVSGTLALCGDEETPLCVKSTHDGTPWLLNVLGAADVSYVTAWDSDASAGKPVVDIAGTIKDTENWSVITPVVPGATNRWTGLDAERPTEWTSAANWSQGRAPAETDAVVIPSGQLSYPVLASATAFNALVVEGGATLDLNGCAISVTNRLRVAGTLKYAGGETITFTGDEIDFAGGALSGPAGQLNLTLAGDGALRADLAGLSWGLVALSGRTGSVAWASGFAADKLACTAGGELAMTFAAYGGVTLRELALDGAGGGEERRITLASSTPGVAWRLAVTQFASATGLTVSDSDASGSAFVPCADQPSQDGGGNANWVFTRTRSTWLGGSGSFTNAAKWSAGKVPDKDTLAIVTSNATMTVEGDAYVGELRILGAGNRIKGTKALYVGGTLYLSGGALTLDAPLVATNAALLVNGSTITHTANTSVDAQELNLSVVGDLTVDATSAITAEGKGYSLTHYYPGARSGGDNCAHGGRDCGGSASCYGSVFRPRTSGSSTDSYAAGGGRVWLVVGGLATINGKVSADGQSSGWCWRTGSGGSVYFAAGALAGSGLISAKGGTANSDGFGSSGGGRIAVYVKDSADFAAFAASGGRITAYGSRYTGAGNYPTASCGTVYLEGADGSKRLVLDNDNGTYADCRVDFPVPEDRGGDAVRLFKGVTLVIRNRGGVNLVGDLRVKDVEVETANTSKCTFFLNDHTLTIRSRAHKNGKGWATCKRNAGTDGAGRIVWQPQLLGVILR